MLEVQPRAGRITWMGPSRPHVLRDHTWTYTKSWGHGVEVAREASPLKAKQLCPPPGQDSDRDRR